MFADKAMLLAIAQDLREPLLHIAYTAELASLTKNVDMFSDIQLVAKGVMTDIDSLLLGLRATQGQLELPLSPVAPSAVLYEALQELREAATRYDCKLFLDNSRQGVLGLAMIHAPTLKHVVCALSQMLMKVGSGHSKNRELHLKLSGSSARPGLSILFRGDIAQIIRDIQTRSKQPPLRSAKSTLFTAGPAAGYRISQQLLQGMEARLQTAHESNLYGFQIRLLASTQLNLL